MSIKYNIVQLHDGRPLDEEEEELTLMQLCKICKAPSSLIIEMVNEGILEPKGKRISSWRFTYLERDKVLTVQHLQNDLRVNLPGAALALQLLEKIARLEAQHNRH
jgi:chaperone modulatory protein CbpM